MSNHQIPSIIPSLTLSNGVQMPQVGLGVWKTKGEEVVNAVQYAIKAGYRLIDTAAVYRNEAEVGQGIQASGIDRRELFVTTKVWNADHGYDSTLHAYEESCKNLGLDYVDLYLIHWPVKGKFKETWRAIEKLYEDGAVRAIGVSNFNVHQLEDLMADAATKPMIDQVELHPLMSQRAIREFAAANDIRVQSWSPLIQGNLDLPALADIAGRHGKSTAQIILRWHVQNGLLIIPKSVREERIVQNAKLFDFALSDAEMRLIDGLNQNHRLGPDPDNFDF